MNPVSEVHAELPVGIKEGLDGKEILMASTAQGFVATKRTIFGVGVTILGLHI